MCLRCSVQLAKDSGDRLGLKRARLASSRRPVVRLAPVTVDVGALKLDALGAAAKPTPSLHGPGGAPALVARSANGGTGQAAVVNISDQAAKGLAAISSTPKTPQRSARTPKSPGGERGGTAGGERGGTAASADRDRDGSVRPASVRGSVASTDSWSVSLPDRPQPPLDEEALFAALKREMEAAARRGGAAYKHANRRGVGWAAGGGKVGAHVDPEMAKLGASIGMIRTYLELLARFSQQHFLVYRGATLRSTPDFLGFQRHFASRWSELECAIGQLEALLTRFSVPLAVVDGAKLALVAIAAADAKVRRPDLLDCLENLDQVGPLLALPGHRPPPGDSKGAVRRGAAVLVQTMVRGRQERLRFVVRLAGERAATKIEAISRCKLGIWRGERLLAASRAQRRLLGLQLKARLARQWAASGGRAPGERVEVHLPSLTLAESLRGKDPTFPYCQNHDALCRLAALGFDPTLKHIVLVSPVDIGDDVLRHWASCVAVALTEANGASSGVAAAKDGGLGGGSGGGGGGDGGGGCRSTTFEQQGSPPPPQLSASLESTAFSATFGSSTFGSVPGGNDGYGDGGGNYGNDQAHGSGGGSGFRGEGVKQRRVTADEVLERISVVVPEEAASFAPHTSLADALRYSPLALQRIRRLVGRLAGFADEGDEGDEATAAEAGAGMTRAGAGATAAALGGEVNVEGLDAAAAAGVAAANERAARVAADEELAATACSLAGGRLLASSCRATERRSCVLVPGQMGWQEEALSVELGLPLFSGGAAEAENLRTRSGAKALFQAAGVAVGIGAHDVRTKDDLAIALAKCIAVHLDVDEWTLRADHDVGQHRSLGAAVVRVSDLPCVNALREERHQMALKASGLGGDGGTDGGSSVGSLSLASRSRSRGGTTGGGGGGGGMSVATAPSSRGSSRGAGSFGVGVEGEGEKVALDFSGWLSPDVQLLARTRVLKDLRAFLPSKVVLASPRLFLRGWSEYLPWLLRHGGVVEAEPPSLVGRVAAHVILGPHAAAVAVANTEGAQRVKDANASAAAAHAASLAEATAAVETTKADLALADKLAGKRGGSEQGKAKLAAAAAEALALFKAAEARLAYVVANPAVVLPDYVPAALPEGAVTVMGTQELLCTSLRAVAVASHPQRCVAPGALDAAAAAGGAALLGRGVVGPATLTFAVVRDHGRPGKPLRMWGEAVEPWLSPAAAAHGTCRLLAAAAAPRPPSPRTAAREAGAAVLAHGLAAHPTHPFLPPRGPDAAMGRAPHPQLAVASFTNSAEGGAAGAAGAEGGATDPAAATKAGAGGVGTGLSVPDLALATAMSGLSVAGDSTATTATTAPASAAEQQAATGTGTGVGTGALAARPSQRPQSVLAYVTTVGAVRHPGLASFSWGQLLKAARLQGHAFDRVSGHGEVFWPVDSLAGGAVACAALAGAGNERAAARGFDGLVNNLLALRVGTRTKAAAALSGAAAAAALARGDLVALADTDDGLDDFMALSALAAGCSGAFERRLADQRASRAAAAAAAVAAVEREAALAAATRRLEEKKKQKEADARAGKSRSPNRRARA